MKVIQVRHEGPQQGPFGERAGAHMADWRRWQVLEAHAMVEGNELVAAFYRGMAALSLARTLEGRAN